MTILIDDFNSIIPNVGSLVRLGVSASYPAASYLESNLATAIGGTRQTNFSYITPTNIHAQNTMSIGWGLLSVTNDPVFRNGTSGNSILQLLWNSGGAGLNLNISSLSGFTVVHPFTLALNNIVTLKIEAQRFVTSGPVSSCSVNVTTTPLVEFPFAAFSDPSFFGEKFDSLKLIITGKPTHRIALDSISVV